MLKILSTAIVLIVFSTASFASSKPVESGFTVQECPPINNLEKRGLFWRGPGDWKSFDESIVKELDHFVGAQWVGVNVGKIICVYKGKRQGVFPVTIERELLVPAPIGGKWGKDQGGYVNCTSVLRKDCSFKVKQETLEADVYKFLESFKK